MLSPFTANDPATAASSRTSCGSELASSTSFSASDLGGGCSFVADDFASSASAILRRSSVLRHRKSPRTSMMPRL